MEQVVVLGAARAPFGEALSFSGVLKVGGGGKTIDRFGGEDSELEHSICERRGLAAISSGGEQGDAVLVEVQL